MDNPKNLSDQQLAFKSQMIFDIPPKMRKLLVIAGIVGIVFIVMEGLITGKPSKVEMDKIVHFTGYTIVATVMVLGLRPLLMIPALLGLIGVGIAAEYVQAMFGRSFEYGDMIANASGVSFGLILGILIRKTYNFIRRELSYTHLRKNLLSYNSGEIILNQGDQLNKFYLIKTGRVNIYRTEDGIRELINSAAAGQSIGALGLILGQEQYTDIVAEEYTEIYGLSLGELMESAGGKELPVSVLLQQAAEYIIKSNEEITVLKRNSGQ